jgi:hypothetical protein
MQEPKNTKQVKTKQRVTDHGEVFTNEREVNAMLDLVKQETERIDSRFLEPACGTGNFMVEVLRRKLEVVKRRYKKSQLEYERYAVIAVGSIYGIDLLLDNVEECRNRLYQLFEQQYWKLYKEQAKEACLLSVQFILSKNIMQGDALTLQKVDSDAPILFSEWSAVNGSMIKRKDYTLARLLNNQPVEGPNLFSDLGQEAFIPKPEAEFPLTHFLKLNQHV